MSLQVRQAFGRLLAQPGPMKAVQWLAFLAVAACTAQTEQTLRVDDILGRAADARVRQEKSLQQYSATRWYTIRFNRNGDTARMTVQVDYRCGVGKTLVILASNEADGILGRVLRRIVQDEQQASQDPNRDATIITPQNYDVQVLGAEQMDGHRCYVLSLHAKRRSKYLLNGKAWLDAEDFGLVRIAGRPSASLSFWVGKPWIDQCFTKVGGFWVASTNHSITDARLFGRTELTVEAGDYRVPGMDTRVARRTAVAPPAAQVN